MKTFRPKHPRLAALAGLLALVWLALRASPLPDRGLLTDYSTYFTAADGSLLRLELSPSGKLRLKMPLSDFSPELVRGFLAYEDRWFFWHPGINPVAVLRAAWLDLRHRRVLSGASTITLQVARMMDPQPRTLWAKLVEALRALQLEARFSKRQILDLYLNSVPMGGNVEGVGAASYLYFGKPPGALSLGEAALLIGLPRSPEQRRPDLHPEAALRARDQVLGRILPRLRVPPWAAREAYACGLPRHRRPDPLRMPLLVRRCGELAPSQGRGWRLTVRPNLQELCRGLLAQAVRARRGQGLANGALIVVDNRDLRVLAYVGSPDFHDPRGGQIDGADIPRSPGSALKPLLYGLALDQGLITPRSVLMDIPRDFAGFKPADYEPGFLGPVTARDALALSLNVPAVELEERLQRGEDLLDLLRRAGFNDRGRLALRPGLSVALGAYPVTLEEMARLYACLAGGGVLKGLRFFDNQPRDPGRRLLSPQACYLVLEMLSRVKRPDLPSNWEFSPHLSRVAFKTGTSFGLRDAWCMGVTPRYTVGVWLGNADSNGSPALIGAKAAAPLMMEVMDRLSASTDDWFSRPPGIAWRRVCAVSGQPAGPWCRDTVEDEYIPGVSPMQACQVHRAFWVRRRDGLRVEPGCMDGPASRYERRVFAVWPPDLTRFLRASGRPYQKLPALAPGCGPAPGLAGPVITSPRPGGVYRITAALPADRQRLAFAAQAGPDTRRLYWFLGGTLLFQGGPDEVFYWKPSPGGFHVSVLDDEGRSSRADFRVLREGR